MRQFFAILKDSFREAVDGFVIYVMLGLSAILILIAASMSFTPTAPDHAFGKIVEQFAIVFQDKSRSRTPSFSFGVKYKASDVKPEGNGYRLQLTATAPVRKGDNKKGPDGTFGHDRAQGDEFRATVLNWAGKVGAKISAPPVGGKKMEGALPTASTADDQKAVPNDLMEAFIANQFEMLAGMNATVKRVTDELSEPSYVFDVTTSGGSSVRGWPHATKIFFGAVTLDDETPLGGMLWAVEDIIINRFGGTMAILVGLIITAFFIPNMLRKGSVDLLISKPIGRGPLLVYKYVGGLTFMLLVSAFTVGGIWFVLALRSGYWDPSFLIAIPLLTLSFGVLYAVSTLAAVVTRSAIAAMLLSVGFAFFLFVFGQIKAEYDDRRVKNPDVPRSAWVATVVDGGSDILPRTRDLDQMIRRAITRGTLPPTMERLALQTAGDPPPAYATFGVTFAFIALMLGLSCWWFTKRDY
jgi:ABC-type transport system involved in multi-copper enzyme maturation permease subunit